MYECARSLEIFFYRRPCFCLLAVRAEVFFFNLCTQVTESGTKAAAVTSISISITAVFIPQPSDIFKADHAFLFVLRDKTNGVNLFMGRVTDPPAAGH